MKLLLNDRNLIIAIGSSIEYGEWGNAKGVYSWKINQNSYAMDNNYTVEDIGDTEIPLYVREGQYYYIDGEFKLADECPNEYKEKVEALEATIVLTEQTITDLDLKDIEMEQTITDMDLRILEMEAKV